MPAPTTPEEAVRARLAGDTAVNSAVSGRINPQTNTQEAVLPYITFKKTGGGPSPRLNGSGKVAGYQFSLEVYATTETGAAAVGKLVTACLFPEGAWRDLPNGVQGCFPVDAAQDITDDPYRVWAQDFVLWFQS